MIGKSAIACGVLLPALALVSGSAVDSKTEDGATVAALVVEMFDIGSAPEEMDCSFAIRASNNQSFDVWVDLYSSSLNNGGFGVFGGFKPLKIQDHRIASGKSMDRRYTASGSCSKERKWQFNVRIGRADGKKIYKYINKTTKGDANRTIDLGKSSNWGL